MVSPESVLVYCMPTAAEIVYTHSKQKEKADLRDRLGAKFGGLI